MVIMTIMFHRWDKYMRNSNVSPMLFSMYIKPLSAIIDSHSIIHHSFADDLQLQMSAPQIEYLSYFTLCSHV